MRECPAWWEWELDLHPHLYKRMADRDFTEVDVRSMLQATTRLRRDVEPGRWIASSRLGRRRWEVILEPDFAEQRVIVITAYPTGL